MQSRSLFLILFILIIAPILIISSNHNLFFGLVAFIMFIAALRTIFKTLSGSKDIESEEQSEKEELEDMIGLDAQKFGIGAKVVKDSIVILFYIYSLFYIQHMWLKIIALLLICSSCVNIKRDLTEPVQTDTIQNPSRLYSVYTFAAAVLTLLVLALVCYNKMVTPLF